MVAIDGVARCPFLRHLASEGSSAQAGACPFERYFSASTASVRASGAEPSSIDAAARVIHGPGGAVPLKRFADGGSGSGGCPFARSAASEQLPSAHEELPVLTSKDAPRAIRHAAGEQPAALGVARLSPLMASISLTGGFGFLVSELWVR